VICEEDHREGLDSLLGPLTQDELWDVLAAARCLGMKDLHRTAGSRLQDILASSIAPDTAASWVARARRHTAPQLLKAGLDFVSKHGREVLLSMAGEDWSEDLPSYESIVLAAINRPSEVGTSSNGGA